MLDLWVPGNAGDRTSRALKQHVGEEEAEFGDSHLGRWAGLMAGFLMTLAEEVGCGTVEGLLTYVQERQLFGVESVITETERSLFVDFHQRVAWPNILPQELCVSPPNCVPALFHWRILAAIVSSLPGDQCWYL